MRRTVRLWSVDEESEGSPVVEEAESEQEAQPEEENATAEEEGAADEGEGTEGHDEGVEWNSSGRALAYNPHFPNSNQTKHCWSSYVNYHQCVKLKVL